MAGQLYCCLMVHGTLGAWIILGHRRRYTVESLRALAEECGFEVDHLIMFNRLGTAAWFLNGKLLRRRHFGLSQIWLLNLITPLSRRVDPMLPFPALSLIAIMRQVSDLATRQESNQSARTAERTAPASAEM